LHILEKMNKVLSAPKEEVSPHAPVIMTMQINPKKIRDVIGKGGANIRALTEKTGAEIDIDDDGHVSIYASGKENADATVAAIKEVCFEPEIGKVYPGVVKNIVDFGAFVAIAPGTEGLVHISQINDQRVENVNDFLTLDQRLNVKVLDIDARDRIKLTMKDVTQS